MTMQSTRKTATASSPGNSAPSNQDGLDPAAVFQQERARWRFWLIAVVFGMVVLAIFLQLFRYQVVGAGERVLPALPQDPPPRGVIVDANGTPLVVNRYFYQITATPSNFSRPEQREEVARQLQELMGLPYEATLANLTDNADRMFTILADAVTPEDALRFEAFKDEMRQTRGHTPIHSVYADAKARRFYPQGALTSHLVGFVRMDYGGITGVEEYYEQFLRRDGAGLLGDVRIDFDTLPPQVQRFIPSEVGKDLILTFDRTMQWIAREELAAGIEEYGAQAGSVIILEPSTGAILAMVNLPDYDPNRYQLAEYSLFPNPAISAQYEPGSVFKIITFGAAVDIGAIDHATIFTDTGIHVIGGRTIFNANRVGHGQIDAADALARSLNVVTAQIADILGPEDFYHYVRLFGFGDATGVDLPGEISGALKVPNTPDWSLSDLGTNSFGQGLAVTPLQMANATAAIANDGILMQPHIVQARVTDGQVQVTEPNMIRRVMSPEAADALTEMMIWVVNNGSPRSRVPGYRVAGKSGTAQIPTPQGYTERETIVSFVGFAPADDPQFVILVKMDRPDPDIGIWAGETAAPVFSRIAKRLLDYMQIPPDEIRVGEFGE
jgi:cell division protein FtsI/penicillin-binding protein 2